MTATILMIRHAAHAHLGNVLSGRTAGGGLTDEGKGQARKLAQHLALEPLAEVVTSPVPRARETADEIARAHGITPQVAEELDEVDFGRWTGRRFDELEEDPAWTVWNEHRATAGAPNGETMMQVQQRMWSYAEELARHLPNRMVAVVSHCDTIRATIAAALGLSLDNLLRFDVPPASVSRLEVGKWGARLLSLNEVRT